MQQAIGSQHPEAGFFSDIVADLEGGPVVPLKIP